MKKQKPIKPQGPWQIISYSDIQNKGTENEFDPGYIEFYHHETRNRFYKEMSWLKGEGVYGEIKNYKLPNPIDIWNMLLRHTPGFSMFIYKNWHIQKNAGCFIIRLASNEYDQYIDKKILSDYTCSKMDFSSFLDMLDEIEKQHADKQEKKIFNLNEMRQRIAK